MKTISAKYDNSPNTKSTSKKIFYIIILCLASLQLQHLSASNIPKLYDYLISKVNSCLRQNVAACKDLIELGLPSKKDCDPFTCNIIGTVLMFANKESEAIGYFKTACNTRYLESCFGLALSYEALQDYNNAKLSYQIACDKNHAPSCYNLAILYIQNAYNKKDYMEANYLLQKACNQMYAKACFNNAILYANGEGVKRNLSYAKLYFDKACDMGLKEACKNLDILNRHGIRMPSSKKVRGFYSERL